MENGELPADANIRTVAFFLNGLIDKRNGKKDNGKTIIVASRNFQFSIIMSALSELNLMSLIFNWR
jgi:hypothetical protein